MIADELNNSLAFNITRVGVLLRRDLIHALKEYKITPEQWQVIISLYLHDTPLSQRELTEATLKDRHAMSRLITRLEKNGWIKKEASSDDGRATKITLTEKGRKMKDEMHEKLTHHVKNNAFSALSDDEKKNILVLMKKIRGTLGDLS